MTACVDRTLPSPERSAHCGSTLHTYDCCTGADPRRLDLTSTRSCSGFMPGGMVISSSMFSRYRKVKGISRFLPPESVAKRSEEHTSELQSQSNLVCRLLLEKKNNK